MRLRVLVVDDSQPMRQLLRLVLGRDKRFEVVAEAADGRAAVERAKAMQPDLVLLDLRMPVMDGFEALPLLRQAAPDALVVVVSGMDRESVEPRILELGAAGFIEKDAPPSRFQSELLALASQPKLPAPVEG